MDMNQQEPSAEASSVRSASGLLSVTVLPWHQVQRQEKGVAVEDAKAAAHLPERPPNTPPITAATTATVSTSNDKVPDIATQTKGLRLPPRQPGAGPRQSSICHHSKRRSQCVQCYDEGTGGSTICKHRKQKYACRKCFDEGNVATNSLCEHRLIRVKCKNCTPVRHEPKTYRPRVKFDFLDEKDLIPFGELPRGSPSAAAAAQPSSNAVASVSTSATEKIGQQDSTVSQNGSISGDSNNQQGTSQETHPGVPACLKCGKVKRVTLYGFEKRPLCKSCHKILQQALTNARNSGSTSTASSSRGNSATVSPTAQSAGESSTVTSPTGNHKDVQTSTPSVPAPVRKAAVKQSPGTKAIQRRRKAESTGTSTPAPPSSSTSTTYPNKPTLLPSPTLNPSSSTVTIPHIEDPIPIASSASTVSKTEITHSQKSLKPHSKYPQLHQPPQVSIHFPTPEATPHRNGKAITSPSAATPVTLEAFSATTTTSHESTSFHDIQSRKLPQTCFNVSQEYTESRCCIQCGSFSQENIGGGEGEHTEQGNEFLCVRCVSGGVVYTDVTEDEVSDAGTVVEAAAGFLVEGKKVSVAGRKRSGGGRGRKRAESVRSDVSGKDGGPGGGGRPGLRKRVKKEDVGEESKGDGMDADTVYSENVHVLAAAAAVIASMEENESTAGGSMFGGGREIRPSSAASSVEESSVSSASTGQFHDDGDAAEILAALSRG
ncbi:UNVERIFIED_CONTAM: hypothetical protein HDU68_007393 [Siphonaria sp. JEL0065]|nr:hypothetical protein HDU68_007393 [Siphonaria sp. JEL0065]